VLGAPAIPLEIFWIDFEQYRFSERTFGYSSSAKIFLDHSSNPTKSFMVTDSPTIDLVSIFQ
jgi:hypothetical protein